MPCDLPLSRAAFAIKGIRPFHPCGFHFHFFITSARQGFHAFAQDFVPVSQGNKINPVEWIEFCEQWLYDRKPYNVTKNIFFIIKQQLSSANIRNFLEICKVPSKIFLGFFSELRNTASILQIFFSKIPEKVKESGKS